MNNPSIRLMEKPRRIFGIDFSGAQDAGKKIWITSGFSVGQGLIVEDCLRARDLPHSGRRLGACLPAIVELVKSNQNAVFGGSLGKNQTLQLSRAEHH